MQTTTSHTHTVKHAVKKVVIAGGGTAGWVAAAALSKRLQGLVEVVLVESEQISTVGVGESTVPPVQLFHNLLGINEQEFMSATDATFKLAINFENWGQLGDRYLHPFGVTGKSTFLSDFQHYYLHGLSLGIDAPFGDYCYELQAAKLHRFGKTDSSVINYAYHLDAGRYARFLRRFSEALGAVRIEGKIAQVQQHVNGDIRSLVLESGQEITGDLFIDCTGFRALLMEQTLKTGYEPWDHWLPCNRAVVVQTAPGPTLPPYTSALAHDSGWQWRIPLQHRVGTGVVYAGDYLSDDKARERLLGNLEGAALREPWLLKYQTGRRKKLWHKNCVAIGLSSGFIEPLESTSIFLFMSGVIRLLRLFPFHGVTPALVDEYNQQTITEVEKIRDFVILHYHQTERTDSDFWNYCRTMTVPDSLAHRMELFRESAHAFQTGDEMFRLESWSHVMMGQRLQPQSYHKLVAAVNPQEFSRHLQNIRETINRAVDRLPSHQDFLRQYCPSNDQ